MTIKKYDICFDSLLERIKESGHAWECYEVMNLLYDIFNDICPKEFIYKLQAIVVKGDELPQYFWRYKIPLYQTIRKYLSENYCNFIEQYITYDYGRTLLVKQNSETAFIYEDRNIEIKCDMWRTINFQFRLDFTRKIDICLEDINLVIHYHIHQITEKAYLRKIIIRFEKKEKGYVCVFEDDIFKEMYAFKYDLKQYNNNSRLLVEIPVKFLKGTFVTYSVTFKYSEMWSICVSGKRWDDFETMRHIRLADS